LTLPCLPILVYTPRRAGLGPAAGIRARSAKVGTGFASDRARV
jgi:hypothetical protein